MNKNDIKKKIKQLQKLKQQLQFKADALDVRQHAFKIFLNSSYGVLGSVFYPCYDLDNAQAVTMSGQTVTRQMVDYTNKVFQRMIAGTDQVFPQGGFVIAGDTDSVFGQTKVKICKNPTIMLTLKDQKNNTVVKTFKSSDDIVVKRNDETITIKCNQLKRTDIFIRGI